MTQEAVEAVIGTLGMQPCEGTEAVPPNARSHTVLLAGIFLGDQQVSMWGRLWLGAGKAVKVCVRLVIGHCSELGRMSTTAVLSAGEM